jgi:hypothetical protein
MWDRRSFPSVWRIDGRRKKYPCRHPTSEMCNVPQPRRKSPRVTDASLVWLLTVRMPENAEYWRKRAEEARATAEAMQDPECKRIMLDIAEAYERIADRESDETSRDEPTRG